VLLRTKSTFGAKGPPRTLGTLNKNKGLQTLRDGQKCFQSLGDSFAVRVASQIRIVQSGIRNQLRRRDDVNIEIPERCAIAERDDYVYAFEGGCFWVDHTYWVDADIYAHVSSFSY
jgi:hypothetical protein